ncbi:putative steroid C25 dehydrogenase (S25dA4) [Steroidobacter denitrificans]|uniref:Putative steroid C25 dehydrogenase (S25dA4) n=1 Tax=Steroidobacter denitrificans TaxID=465721 RepID=A0A127FAW2_STEDE|nr:molybdopterin-dependent oxidoreductase [Steroidobacter denitrificans]AMN47556.1 putative steroid C25 dehydrogenase (S25dA4) [Steroidobacter denitrificans]
MFKKDFRGGHMATRRHFLQAGVAVVGSLPLRRLAFASNQEGRPIAAAPAYTDWRDVYRKAWTWDRIVHSSHSCNCNNNCSWKVYVRDGIVWREEQTAGYIQHNPGLADYNPLGCNKGGAFSHEMYRTGRLKYPLKRVGERGSGKWRRVSWDEALTDIAMQLIEIIKTDGHDTIIGSLATHSLQGTKGGPSKLRFFDLLGGTMLDSYGDIGDSQAGAMITTGLQAFAGSTDSRMLAKCIILWVFNPAVTRIPDAHFLYEARYRGATIISISPDQNPSHMHADYWINPKPATDPALALAMAHIIVRDRMYDAAFMKEQTDLPFLVRQDTRKFLRAADLEVGGKDDVFYCWDAKSQRLVAAPGSMGSVKKTLLWDEIDPALEGEWDVTLRDGSRVRVHPVFERLKTTLAMHTPEFAAKVTGVGTQTIELIAHTYAQASPGLIELGWGAPKLYHADLLGRAVFLLSALTGNTGKEGGGVWTGGIAAIEGMERLGFPVAGKIGRHRVVPGPSWMYVHGGMHEVCSRWIPVPGKRSGDDYIREALDKRWMPLHPPRDREPRALIECGSNILRRTRMSHILYKNLWPKLKLVVTMDYRMSSTALASDYVLPAAGFYEVEGVKISETRVPFHVYQGKAVNPIAESRDDWHIFGSLLKKLQELAPKNGLTQLHDDEFDYVRDYTRIYDEYTDNGRLAEDVEDEVIVREIMEHTKAHKGITLEQLREKGYADWTNSGSKDNPGSSTSFEVVRGRPLTAATDFTEKKQPWRTLTGRVQFYIDHDWFLEFGEELPVHRDPPKMGGDYPLCLTGGHTRWGIHSLWRDNELMLRLQRGEPLIYMNPADARERGVQDHDEVEVFNDVGRFRCRVMVTPTMQPGQIHSYHAWEPFQFKNHSSMDTVLASQLKPLLFVGNYGHLRYLPLYYQPNNVDRGTRIDVRKVS